MASIDSCSLSAVICPEVNNPFWYKAEAEGQIVGGSSRFVAYLGAVNDDPSRIVNFLGEIPAAETMLELADIVGDVLGTEIRHES